MNLGTFLELVTYCIEKLAFGLHEATDSILQSKS
jgi:hypothetical protein